ncbi:MAG: formate dehydrogenase subunit gamma [Flavobacterium sp.]|jgi:formate dehydrogenase subunit gamma
MNKNNLIYSHQDETKRSIELIIEGLIDKPGALLPILHEIQNQLGYVPQNATPILARKLNLSRAEVHGVISFYHHFSSKPRGKHIIEVCRAESCQSVGGRDLEQYAKDKLKLDWYETSLDGQFTLEPVYCLGNCACSPAVRVGKKILGRVDTQRFDQLLVDLEKTQIMTKEEAES